MADEPENHTLRLLQEIRETLEDMRKDISSLREEIADLRLRVDGNTLVLNMVAGVTADHEARIEALETAPG
ncbi:hypothetical protein EV659_10782 [Rhodothalassium salexigens DSM 2132]|uniref:Uncharacterized protein n=1 Tax=Rhodothalassium salexigens DSM 2132 TaxID=1188247 RepID=A0A4R2PE24_RHOSA|nr:hypothetical protein [Rhodothalassium salexigens]MBB4211944.1 NTP pyrophosphatase (non-canonical NTP hydrolase) [Rhodothalassium salexigens DSM 2132]MBK1639248.1 hypothetical protein [Rhodothalassium salexigens DSM 2132]TCP33472.1 hypothetical protein EV659_10782 [Rhodothalassium salexigens DSM 2132]